MAKETAILVVDDEPPLLRLMLMYLERMGYAVEGFATATDALRRWREEPNRFQVVVADLTLPDMSGEELALSITSENPSVCVLLCSGYPFEVGSLPKPLQRRFAHLQKPFLPNMLAKTVEELLCRGSEPRR